MLRRLLLALLVPSSALADDAITKGAPIPEEHRRAFLYGEEPSLPAVLRPEVALRTTYAGSGFSPSRPFAANTGNPGVTAELGAEVAFTRWLSVRATGMTGSVVETAGSPSVGAGALAGLHLVTPVFLRTQIGLTVGYLREMSGHDGGFVRVAFTHELGRFRFGATGHFEHVFAPARDALDVMVTLGASARVVGPLRVVLEYVGQDFEGIFDAEAEKGYRHFLSTGVAAEFLGKRLTFALGPAIGLSPQSPRALGRAAIAYAF